MRLALFALVLSVSAASAQSVDVTFRFLPDLEAPAITNEVRAFVPGSFNDWGPNASGQIATGAPSQATYVADLDEYRYTTTLQAGQSYAYKIHYHRNASGSEFTWLTDPLGTETTGPNNDSVVRVEDPFVFQVAREQNGTSMVEAVSAGVFGTQPIGSVTFTVNGTTYTDGVTDTGDGIYRLVLPQPVAPGSYVRVDATDSISRTASAEVGAVPPTVTEADVPDGLADGITYDESDPSRAWLVLRAPGKQYVYALGDFNGWTADADALLFRDSDAEHGTRWWIELTGLTPGAEHTFYYWVDGQIRVADPYTTKVYYPGESGYPAGAQEHAVGVLTPGASEFAWTDQGFERPAPEDMVVYELLIRDFLRAHSFTALTDTLDYLDRLGVNTIELMPVSEFDGNESWGYNPAFHLALDKYYGTPDQFKAFVDAAHARGMAVLLDVVYNHATGQSPLVRLDNQGDFGPPNPSNPWANVSARHPFNVFNDLDHESPLTQIWLDQANRFWMDEYHVDGYRFDLSKGFTQTCGGGPCTDSNFSAYNPARIAILKRMADALWAEHPDAIVILEHFADASEERELAEYRRDEGRPGMTFWANMNDAYNESAMGYLGNRASLTRAYPPNNNYPIWGQIAYMESHDEQWQMFKLREFGNRSGDYDTREVPTALDRKKLATTFFLTVPGPKMLWQFGEVGYGGGPGECLKNNGDGDCRPSDPGRVGNKPIRWDYWADVPPFANGTGLSLTRTDDTERGQRRKLYAVTAALLDLREQNDIFHSAETVVTSRLAGGVGDRWIQLALDGAPEGQPTRAVVFGNFAVTEREVTLTFDQAQTWYDYFDDTEVSLQAGQHSFTLRPGEFHVWTNVDVGSPDGDLGAVADEAGPDGTADRLVAVFPNPTASRARVSFELAAPRDVTLEVFDALGRRVSVVDGAFGAGPHTVDLDVAALPAGVYLVRWDGQSVPLTVAR